MDNVPGSINISAASVKPVQNTFLFNLEGHSVVAVKVASKVAKQISGQDMKSSGGIIAKLKVKLGLAQETERWFVVSSVDNPLLEEIWFGALIADRLSKATGTTVSESDLAISASVPVSGIGEKDESSDAVRDDRKELVTQPITT